MNTTIPDFTDAELKLVSASLFERYGKLVLERYGKLVLERYGKLVPVQLADSEL